MLLLSSRAAVVTVTIVILMELDLATGQQQQGAPDQCLDGLFVSEQSIKAMKSSQGPSFRDLYKLSSFRTEVTHEESCGVKVNEARQSASLTDCAAQNYQNLIGKRGASTCQPCCTTQMSFSVPYTVTDVYTGLQHQAKHFPTSYQLLHLGQCTNEGAGCGYQGTCQQATRIEWVLVTLPSGDKFVPTTVPSHCTCIYS